MGLYDRHYTRASGDGPSGLGGGPGGAGRGFGVGGMRAWSFNTWIIAICVAIFVVDGFLQPQPVRMDLVPLPEAGLVHDAGLEAGTLVIAARDRAGNPSAGRLEAVRVADDGTSELVGYWKVRWMHPIEKYLHFSTLRGFFKIEFWRLIGFQFLHSHETLFHLLFNMMGLFFFGPLVEQYLGSKRYLAFYLLCGIFGALMYTLLNVLGMTLATLGVGTVPGLLFNDLGTPLIGASAGVYGVLMAGAVLAPDTRVLLFFFLPVRLATLAYGLVILSVLTILLQGDNAGGEAGHLGGAIAGFYFIRHPHHLHKFFDLLGRVDPTSDQYIGRREGREPRARAMAKSPGAAKPARRGGPDPVEVDRVLDKVHAEGLASLTEKEKRILREASESGD